MKALQHSAIFSPVHICWFTFTNYSMHPAYRLIWKNLSNWWIAIIIVIVLSQIKVDGGWAAWGNWTKCSVSCGGGTKTRFRSCTNPPAAHGGKTCLGLKEMTHDCNKDTMCPGRKTINSFSTVHIIATIIFFLFSEWWLDSLGKLERMQCDLWWRNKNTFSLMHQPSRSPWWWRLCGSEGNDTGLQQWRVLSR